MPRAAPAHETKHIARLEAPLPGSDDVVVLHQSQNSGSTSSSLWLGSQVLALYLSSELRWSAASRKAIELGAGTGLCSLALASASLGWDVLATDLPDCIPRLQASVDENVAAHPLWKGRVTCIGLDWTAAMPQVAVEHEAQLIVSADCVFDTRHVDPLINTLRALSGNRQPTILVALERRDPALVDHFLDKSRQAGFVLSQIPKTKLRKLVAAHYGWEREAWSDVEVWRFKPP